MRKVRFHLIIRSLVITKVVLIDIGDVGGSVALFVLLIRIFTVLFFFTVTPIGVSFWALACICSKGGKVSRARAFSALYVCGRARAFSALYA